MQESALTEMKLGSTSIGICTDEGVVLGVEKRLQSSLLVSSSVEKIMEIDSHVGCAMSGLTADARTIVEHARITGQGHRFRYDEPISVSAVTKSIGNLAMQFGESIHKEDATMVRYLCDYQKLELTACSRVPSESPCL